METLKTIATRSSVREFTGEKISEEIIEKLLRAAMAAPSAMNQQPWEFIVVRDSARLKEIAEHPDLHASMSDKAAIGILVCGDVSKSYQKYWSQDCAIATQNLLLAVHALNLGAVWTGIFSDSQREKIFHEIFELPQNIEPFAFIPIGVPAEENIPKNKFDPKKIHQEQW